MRRSSWIRALKDEISIPIHLHTHDTTGNGGATALMAAEAGVDIVDTALNSMAGLTSQPALNSLVAAAQQHGAGYGNRPEGHPEVVRLLGSGPAGLLSL